MKKVLVLFRGGDAHNGQPGRSGGGASQDFDVFPKRVFVREVLARQGFIYDGNGRNIFTV